MQTIDGFLAVLNVTGGSFFPTTQKLPFSVTSIDEDSSLLYYSSIDLAGRLPSNNSKSPKLQRSYSNNDSRSAKSRLRIPVKGRIQLVLNCFRSLTLINIVLTFDQFNFGEIIVLYRALVYAFFLYLNSFIIKYLYKLPGLTRPVDIRNSLTMELSAFALIELLTAKIKHN